MNLPIRLAAPLLAAAMGSLLLLALGREVAVWALLAWFLGSGLSILGALRRRLPWFGGRQRFFLALVGVIAAAIVEGWGNWLPMLTQMVIWLLAVKALELRGQRDFYQMAALTLLGLGIAAWLRVDLILPFCSWPPSTLPCWASCGSPWRMSTRAWPGISSSGEILPA